MYDFILLRGYLVLLGVIIVSVTFFFVKRSWHWALRLALIFTILAIIAYLPMYIGGSGCSSSYTHHSYLKPWGEHRVVGDRGVSCALSLNTTAQLQWRFAFTDLAIIFWVVYAVDGVMQKRRRQ